MSANLITGYPAIHENVSSLLNCNSSVRKPGESKTPQFLLFGQPILTKQQISLSSFGATSLWCFRNGSSDEISCKMANLSDGSLSAINHHRSIDNFSFESSFCCKNHQASDTGLKSRHCKVFMESNNVGHTLDLSVIGSYEELYTRLAEMFSIDNFDMKKHLRYLDAIGAFEHMGVVPFSDFMKSTRRLHILIDS